MKIDSKRKSVLLMKCRKYRKIVRRRGNMWKFGFKRNVAIRFKSDRRAWRKTKSETSISNKKHILKFLIQNIIKKFNIVLPFNPFTHDSDENF
jgi:hypothetical protein